MTLIFETQQFGRLWLGGEKAAHNSKLLADNEVYAVWPAYKGARPEIPSVYVFDVVDGTGACNGDISLKKVMDIVTDIVALLLAGKSVLIACHNGAHRSATLACLVLIRLTAWSASEAAFYLTSMRNIVDLNSRAPPSAYRTISKRPLDFLEEVEAEFRTTDALATAKPALGFVPLRRKALEAGFEVKFPSPKSLATPAAKRREGSSGDETVGSFELATDGDVTDGGSVHGSNKGWTLFDTATPASTPAASSCGEGSELRRRKIRMLMEDLTALNRKLEGHVDTAGGFEPGLTLTDSSGNTAAVAVGSELTLIPPAASDDAAPQASAVASPPAVSEVAAPQAALAKDPAVKEETPLDKTASEPAVAAERPTETLAAKQEDGEAKPGASTSTSASFFGLKMVSCLLIACFQFPNTQKKMYWWIIFILLGQQFLFETESRI